MSCLGINCIPTPEAYAKKLVAKMKKTASEGGDIMEEHGAELVRAIAAGELVLDVLHLHDVFSSHKEHAQHLDRETCVRHKKLPTVLPMGSLLDELRTSPVDLHPEVKESDGTFTRIIKNLEFQNWGRTVQNRPEVTFLPHSKEAVCNIVKWSLQKGYTTVRASGYRHTWSDLYSRDGQVLVAMLPLCVTNKLPAPIPSIEKGNDLMGIEMVGEIQEADGATKGLCKIGAATTNQMFREWAVSKVGGWTVPINVIMSEISWGGSNAPICHGAGLRHQTLSDLVHELELVNARGELQVINDKEVIKAAAGCFGLLGIVVSLTLKVDPMTYAVVYAQKIPMELMIPPLDQKEMPLELRTLEHITPLMAEQAKANFEVRAQNAFYAEWFWFIGQKNGWQNCWDVDDSAKDDAEPFPAAWQEKLQWVEGFLGQVLNDFFTLFPALGDALQTKLLSSLTMHVMPDLQYTDKPIICPVIDALHFRRGIQNMRVYDMEWQIPIPEDESGGPDWDLCRRAWWDAINVSCTDPKKGAIRIAVEMRIVGDSEVLMAPFFGNRHGTCSIEVLTTENVKREDWLPFCQAILDKFAEYKDRNGQYLNIRPHWAKEWQDLTVRGVPVTTYLKDAYKDRIPEFKALLAEGARQGGLSPEELSLFKSPLMSEILGEY